MSASKSRRVPSIWTRWGSSSISLSGILRRRELARQASRRLRAEVEQLRAALSAAEPSHDDVQVGLHGVRTKLDELGDELKIGAVTGSDYLARIGRLLGLG